MMSERSNPIWDSLEQYIKPQNDVYFQLYPNSERKWIRIAGTPNYCSVSNNNSLKWL